MVNNCVTEVCGSHNEGTTLVPRQALLQDITEALCVLNTVMEQLVLITVKFNLVWVAAHLLAIVAIKR
jgi:hypothetical protein